MAVTQGLFVPLDQQVEVVVPGLGRRLLGRLLAHGVALVPPTDTQVLA
jgi:hypothetical protein